MTQGHRPLGYGAHILDVSTHCGIIIGDSVDGCSWSTPNSKERGFELYEPTVVLRPDFVLVGDHSRIDAFCKIEGGLGVVIGEHTHISSFSHIGLGGGYTWIGRHVGISSGVRVVSGTHKMDAPSMSASSPRELQHVERLTVMIDDQAFLGAGCTVMPGAMVGRGAVVGAGALVRGYVAPWDIVAGVPARKIGEREPFGPIP